jgi:hypothetical protein
MPANVARVVLAVLLLQGCSPDAGEGPEQGGDVRPNAAWALEVLTLESTAPTALWVGVINRSGEARLVCILDRGISFNEKDGTSKGVVEGGSPHACDVDEQFQLVRAGQTLFTRVTLPEGPPARVAGRIRVEVGVVDRLATGKASRREPVGVTWEGTLEEAEALGRTLTDAAQKRK